MAHFRVPFTHLVLVIDEPGLRYIKSMKPADLYICCTPIKSINDASQDLSLDFSKRLTKYKIQLHEGAEEILIKPGGSDEFNPTSIYVILLSFISLM